MINFGITTNLDIGGFVTLSGTQVAYSGTNHLRVGNDITLTSVDSGNLVSQIMSAAGVLSLNGATGTVTLASAPANAGYVGISNSGTTIYVSGRPSPAFSSVLVSGDGLLTGNFSVGSTALGYKLGVSGNLNTEFIRFMAGPQSLGFSLYTPNSMGANVCYNGVPTFSWHAGGGVLIGGSYAGSAAPANGLVVQGSLGVGTLVPSESFHVSGGSARIEQNVYGMSGIFFRDTGNYTSSGAASVAQLTTLSGLLNFQLVQTGNSRGYTGAVGIGVDFVAVTFTPAFPGIPAVTASAQVTGNIMYLVNVSGVTANGYNALFSSTTTENLILNTNAQYRT